MKEPKVSGRILELDGLRAISVLLVVFAHQIAVAKLISYSPSFHPVLDVLGATGVQMFFVISGFIITRLQARELAVTGRVSIIQFYIRRFFRIIPAYWTYLATITVLWLINEISLKGEALWRSVLFLSDFKWYTKPEGWFCGHTWTLSVEEQYYLMFSLLMPALGRGRSRWLFGFLLLAYAGAIMSARLSWMTHIGFIAYLSPFKFIIAGMLMAMSWSRAGELIKGLPPAVPFLLIAFLLLRPAYAGSHILSLLLVDWIDPIAIAILVGWVIQHPGECSFLRWPLLQGIGVASYSIYLWQQLFAAPPDLYGHYVLSTPGVGLVLLIGCAAASLYWIERPCIRLARKICAKLEARTMATPANDTSYVIH